MSRGLHEPCRSPAANCFGTDKLAAYCRSRSVASASCNSPSGSGHGYSHPAGKRNPRMFSGHFGRGPHAPIALRHPYRTHRPIVERKISHFTRRPWGGRKARCRGQARILTDVLTRAGVINLARLATLGLNTGPAAGPSPDPDQRAHTSASAPSQHLQATTVTHPRSQPKTRFVQPARPHSSSDLPNSFRSGAS